MLSFPISRELLIDFLDGHCASENQKLEVDGNDEERSAYDFVYLPLDLRCIRTLLLSIQRGREFMYTNM